jgi:asparagine synthase (glutamine-hydrolysing)
MCGIIGAFGVGADAFDLSQQLLRLKVRGPDSQIIEQPHPFLVMGATRLAMTDPHPRSNQPFSKNGNWIVFNGEIYNYEFLREFLRENQGITFRTYSDTEVLLELLTIYGQEAVEMLNGMYAFAFYDAFKQKLFLARDDLGKKPLYFLKQSNKLLWSSTIETLVSLSSSTTVNEKALIEYLAFGYTIDSNTIYNEVTAVRPGTIIEFDINLSESINTSLKFNEKFAKGCDGLRDAIKVAVDERINSHGSVAISLSGGLDSSIVTLLAKGRNVDVTSYSLKWTDSDKERYNTDADFARKIASRIGVNFTAVDFSAKNDLERHLKSFIKVMGEPNSNPTGVSMIPLYSQVKQDNHRLILTGDGADEIFGGYPRYESFLVGDFFRFLSSSKTWQLSNKGDLLRKLALRVGSLENPALWANFHWNFQPKEISKILAKSDLQTTDQLAQTLYTSIELSRFKDHQLKPKRTIQSIMELDSRIWLTNESNRKLDRVSMGYSIEARSPFQDSRVIELARSAIQKRKSRSISDKAILREAFPEIKHLGIRQDKAGFISPVGHWLRTNPKIVKSGLEAINETGFFNSQEIARRSTDQFSGDFTKIRQLWSLVVLGYWFLHSWEK